MADYQIPITYVVSASAITPSAGLEPLQLSTILLLTDEAPATAIDGSYMIARSSSAVATAWGTETETAAQANAILAQQPNILANNGYVIVAPISSTVVTPATAGTLTTANLSANLSSLIAVTDGNLTMTVDGNEVALTGIDLSSATTLADVAELIQAQTDAVTVQADGNSLVFTSTTTGTGSSVMLDETVDGAGTDLYGASYLNGATADSVDGENAVTDDETLAEAITRLAKEIYFEGILTTKAVEDAEYVAASNAVEAMNNRIIMLPVSSTNALSGVVANTANNLKTKPVMYLSGDNAAYNARLFAAAYLSRALAVNYNGSNTTLTMNLKTLAGITADTNISEAILAQCDSAGVDCYPSIEGLAKVVSFAHAGQYFDQVTNQLWFVNSIQREVFNVLATTSTKVPQTDAGLEIITKAVRSKCNQGVTNGFIAPGVWNSPDTFGNLDDFYRNIEEFGYYIYHLPVAEQAQSERVERRAPVYMVAAKEAGAVHKANILIYINP